MTDHSKLLEQNSRIGDGVKIAALVFTLGAIALAADLAWMAPGKIPTPDYAVRPVAASETPENARYTPMPAPSPSTTAAGEAEPHIQAF